MKLIKVLNSDLRKVRHGVGLKQWTTALFANQSFKMILLYRIDKSVNNRALQCILGGVKRIYSAIHCVYISREADIDEGFCISHCFSIIIAGAKIGKNCVVMQQVTIGSSRGGNRSGYPKIGNNVVVCCGAKIIGNVTIGNNVIIGANAVVTKDIPDNACVAGIPAKIINMNGEEHTKYWCMDL